MYDYVHIHVYSLSSYLGYLILGRKSSNSFFFGGGKVEVSVDFDKMLSILREQNKLNFVLSIDNNYHCNTYLMS